MWMETGKYDEDPERQRLTGTRGPGQRQIEEYRDEDGGDDESDAGQDRSPNDGAQLIDGGGDAWNEDSQHSSGGRSAVHISGLH